MICDIFCFNLSHFLRSVTVFFFFNGGLGSVVQHRESMCICAYCMCVCVTCLREREPVQGGVEGLGGFNSREADGAEGRRLMQQRAQERERKKQREDLEQIG